MFCNDDRGKILLRDQLDFICPALSAKIFRFLLCPNQFHNSRRPAPHEGRSRSSRTWGGMRWTRAAPLTNGARCGRRSRVVLTPRRWRQVGGSHSADDGDKKARSPGRSRNKPLKPSRAGMPGDPGGPVVATLVCHQHTAHEAAGATGTRHSPRPLISRARSLHGQPGHIVPRDRGPAPLPTGRHRPRKRTIQYSRDVSDGIDRPRGTGYPRMRGYGG